MILTSASPRSATSMWSKAETPSRSMVVTTASSGGATDEDDCADDEPPPVIGVDCSTTSCANDCGADGTAPEPSPPAPLSSCRAPPPGPRPSPLLQPQPAPSGPPRPGPAPGSRWTKTITVQLKNAHNPSSSTHATPAQAVNANLAHLLAAMRRRLNGGYAAPNEPRTAVDRPTGDSHHCAAMSLPGCCCCSYASSFSIEKNWLWPLGRHRHITQL